MARVPKKLQGVLWSRDVSMLDKDKDKNYLIHQVLMYGSLEDIKWLKRTYTKDEIKQVFIQDPRKVYTKSSYNFIKNYLLKIKEKLPESKYVKTAPRNIR